MLMISQVSLHQTLLPLMHATTLTKKKCEKRLGLSTGNYRALGNADKPVLRRLSLEVQEGRHSSSCGVNVASYQPAQL
jgi:hypothetical protein